MLEKMSSVPLLENGSLGTSLPSPSQQRAPVPQFHSRSNPQD